jgi:hypothetical protein
LRSPLRRSAGWQVLAPKMARAARTRGVSANRARANATRRNESADPAVNNGFAADCHAGTADATLLTALRGWASALLPGPHTTHIVCLVARLNAVRKDRSHINSARADNSPLGGTLRHGIYVTQYGIVCRPAAALSRCAQKSRPSRSVGALERPVRHAPRQLAGILHANPPRRWKLN